MIPVLTIGMIFTGNKEIYAADMSNITIKIYENLIESEKVIKLLYNYADQFYVQWEEMLKLYPKAIYKGGIY